MSQIRTVCRREVRGYFDYPTAYILVIAFLALGLFLTLRSLFADNVASMRPFFDLLPWLFAVFVPALTMRSLAEERRSHTLEWLMAQPLAETDILVGKFLGNWLFVLIALAGSVPLAVGLIIAAHADPGIFAAQYIGAILLAAQAVAIGLWASSVTRNQITAFILAVSVSMVLVLIGLDVVTIGLPPVLGGIVIRLSVLPHFENVARGAVDLRDVLYFLSTALLFLVLGGVALARERLSRHRGAWRRLRTGTAVVAASVVVLNLLGGYVRGRLDLTRGHLFTLSPATKTLLRNLGDVVHVNLYVSNQLPPQAQLMLRDVRDLLSDMKSASRGNLKVEEENPDNNAVIAQEAQSYGVEPVNFSVMGTSEFQMKRGWFGIAVTYANKNRAIPAVQETDDLEYQLASDISALTEAHKPTVAFLLGAGSLTGTDFPTFQQVIGDQYTVTSLPVPDSTGLTPDSVKVAILAAPRQPLDSTTIGELGRYLDAGGSLLLLLPPVAMGQMMQPTPMISGLGRFLAEHGIGLGTSVVYDMRAHVNVGLGGQGVYQMVAGYPLFPIAQPAGEHIVTRNLRSLTLSYTAPLTVLDPSHVQPLWVTSKDAGTQPPNRPLAPQAFQPGPTDSLRQYVVAVAAEQGGTPGAGSASHPVAPAGTGRMIVVGNSQFLSDQFAQHSPQNIAFAANAIDWLAQDESLIEIRAKQRTPPTLTFSSTLRAGLFKWGNLIGVPLLFVLIGTVRIIGRVPRARRRWHEPPIGEASHE
jgi:ABC-type uncharacterized transport system involved in gliding motility auxiliary subunit/ABC-type transport system involved in multi-copper enzyme maturation permease subunit